jgi:endonuclease III
MVKNTKAFVVNPRVITEWRSNVASAYGPHSGDDGEASVAIRYLESTLREIAARLHEKYGTPHLGNLADPTDEFAYIVLSRKTAERAYRASFRSLKNLGPWSVIQSLDHDVIERAIQGGGLERKKTAAIIDGLAAIRERFGAPDLSRAAGNCDDELFDFIVSLPEIGPKSALCIMLYSFQRAVFPVDAHVGRVLARTEVMGAVGVDLAPMGHKKRQRELRDLVPPDLRFGLHVNLVAHGRMSCKAVNPCCSDCIIRDLCAWPDSADGVDSRRTEVG